jgi:hypothetical protein
MEVADENLYRQNVSLLGEDMPYYQPGGALFDASHAVMASAGAGGYDG